MTTEEKSPRLSALTSTCLVLLALFFLLTGSGPEQPGSQNLEDEAEHGHVHVLSEPRSGKWPAVRSAYLQKQPACEACASRNQLQVHHVVPFHNDPGKELDPTNLITLCRRCHLLLGHAGNYRLANRHVREDARLISKHVEEAKLSEAK